MREYSAYMLRFTALFLVYPLLVVGSVLMWFGFFIYTASHRDANGIMQKVADVCSKHLDS